MTLWLTKPTNAKAWPRLIVPEQEQVLQETWEIILDSSIQLAMIRVAQVEKDISK